MECSVAVEANRRGVTNLPQVCQYVEWFQDVFFSGTKRDDGDSVSPLLISTYFLLMRLWAKYEIRVPNH